MAADSDSCQDRYGACSMRQADGAAEEHDSSDRADQRLEVEDGRGGLGGDPRLAVGE
jgi:hypothetical protein